MDRYLRHNCRCNASQQMTQLLYLYSEMRRLTSRRADLLKLKLKLPDPSNGRRSNILPLVEEWYKSGEPESALQSYIDKYRASN